MKYLALFLLILLISCNKSDSGIKVKFRPSKIDSLNSESQVQDYFHSLDSNYCYFKLQKIQDIKYWNSFTDSLAKSTADKYTVDESYYKADFDKNGYTDLLVIGDNRWCGTGEQRETLCNFSVYTIMNFGIDSVRVLEIVKHNHGPVIPQIEYKDEQPFIIMHELGNIDKITKKLVNVNSVRLSYKLGDFIEYNDKPVYDEIEKIEFVAQGCMGKCPIFQINIDKSRNALFLADHYNFGDTDHRIYDEGYAFKAVVDVYTYDRLTDMLNYISFKNLNDEYDAPWTDDREAKIRVTYASGRIKIVRDYGMIGTYGLKSVYNIIHNLRFNQDWKKIKEPKGVRFIMYYKDKPVFNTLFTFPWLTI